MSEQNEKQEKVHYIYQLCLDLKDGPTPFQSYQKNTRQFRAVRLFMHYATDRFMQTHSFTSHYVGANATMGMFNDNRFWIMASIRTLLFLIPRDTEFLSKLIANLGRYAADSYDFGGLDI